MPENKLISELLVGSFVIKTFNYQRADFRRQLPEDSEDMLQEPTIFQLKVDVLIIIDIILILI